MEILQQDNCKVLNLTDGRSISDAIKLVNRKKADGINFNFIRNFPLNINEIIHAKNIKFIQINDYSWDFDYSAISYLSKLEHLSIYTSDKREIDFSNYPILKSAAIFWRPKANSLFQCSNLERLFIGKFKDSDLSKFEFLHGLKYLRINTGSIESLKGIEKLQNLQTLLLMQIPKLKNLKGVEKLVNLQHLEIDNCRNINNIDLVSKLQNIKTLQILGTTPILTIEKKNSH